MGILKSLKNEILKINKTSCKLMGKQQEECSSHGAMCI